MLLCIFKEKLVPVIVPPVLAVKESLLVQLKCKRWGLIHSLRSVQRCLLEFSRS